MENKVKGASILITGANGGIGIETVKALIKEGAERIALACRTQTKAEEAIVQLPSSNTKLEPYGGFDMTEEAEIKQAVENLPKGEQFDIVFLQSGGMVVADDFQFVRANGRNIERTIYQNVFGGYMVTQQLKKHGLLSDHARIVFAGGEGARGINGLIKKPEYQSVNELKTYISEGIGKYVDLNAIGASKFMSALLVQKLAEIDPERTYVWFSPGLTARTKGLNSVPNPKRFIMEKIGFPIMQLIGFAQSPERAAEKYVESLKGLHGNSGDIIGAPEGIALGKLVDQKPMSEGLTNLQFRDAFWEIITNTSGNF